MVSCSGWVYSSLPMYLEGLAGFQQALTKCCSHIPSDKFCKDKQFCWGGEGDTAVGKSAHANSSI